MTFRPRMGSQPAQSQIMDTMKRKGDFPASRAIPPKATPTMDSTYSRQVSSSISMPFFFLLRTISFMG